MPEDVSGMSAGPGIPVASSTDHHAAIMLLPESPSPNRTLVCRRCMTGFSIHCTPLESSMSASRNTGLPVRCASSTFTQVCSSMSAHGTDSSRVVNALASVFLAVVEVMFNLA